MSFVIYDQVNDTTYRAPGSHCSSYYNTLRGARAMATRLNKKVVGPVSAVGGVRYVAMSYDEFDRLFNPIITVFNLMSGKPVQIRKSERGGPCDPSTERYFSM